ncbi:MAG TPA: WYL domain-containing protein [Cellulomonadaceae bacterium]|nr:WYL domain-containing protein [Cellulomonadaceae bacterium]
MADPIPPAERLLNLVIALVNTGSRMSKEQIRSTVAGYGDAASDDAFERMFERDKDALRDLGIPILTVTGRGHGDDIGYRIDQDAYAMPQVDLTAAELGVLSLAAQFWQDRSLRTDATRALTKLRAVGSGPEAGDLVAGLSPRVPAAGAALGPLLDAVHARQAVTFSYRAASTGEVRTRVLEPWRLLVREGGWYVVGLDRDRESARSFRLSRIEGPVRGVGPTAAFVVPVGIDPAAVLDSRRAETSAVAVLAVRPERASALRSRAVTGVDGSPQMPGSLVDRDLIRVPYTSITAFVDEVVGYGDAVVVLEPRELRERVVARLRAAAALDPMTDVPGPPAGPDRTPDRAGREEVNRRG